MYNQIPIIATVLSGGLFLGIISDKVNILCEENKTIKREHNDLKEKIFDIHIKVCNIENKLNYLVDK